MQTFIVLIGDTRPGAVLVAADPISSHSQLDGETASFLHKPPVDNPPSSVLNGNPTIECLAPSILHSAQEMDNRQSICGCSVTALLSSCPTLTRPKYAHPTMVTITRMVAMMIKVVMVITMEKVTESPRENQLNSMMPIRLLLVLNTSKADLRL